MKNNQAVAQACNGGNPIVAPQWYFIGEKTRGSLRLDVTATYQDRSLRTWPSGAAVLDHWTGKVLSCATKNFSRTKRPVDVVAFLAERPDPNWPYGDPDPQLAVLIDRIAGPAPANDRMENAEPITSLPFHDELDTSSADDDGPTLEEWACDFGGTSLAQASTVWYSYRPEKTAPAPEIAVRALSNWQGANRMRRTNTLRSNVLEVLPDRQTRRLSDPFDCQTPPTLEVGHDYLFGVYSGWDSYDESALRTGGPIAVTVTIR